MIRKFVIAGLLLVAGWVHAFVPEGGLWAIDAELDGRPGRGLQFDVQGSTMVLTFYGYRADGKATWYQAAGPLAGTVFNASLEQFEGGTPFGQARTSARPVGSAGQVVLTFSSATRGTIVLPGESAKAVSWYNHSRPANPTALQGTYVLERAIVTYTNGVVYDSATNITAVGSMTVDGGQVAQNIRLVVNGQSLTAAPGGRVLTDNGAAVSILNNNGVLSNTRVLRRGDEFTTILSTPTFTEVDQWRRTSAAVVKQAVDGPALGGAAAGAALHELLGGMR